MNTELIAKNEAHNSKKNIFLYLSQVNGLWLAYGHSAFALRLYAKDHGLDSLRIYSMDLKLPCTMVTHLTLKQLRSKLAITDELVDSHVVFATPEEAIFEDKDYLHWNDRVYKESGFEQSQLRIKTTVSDKVPKDVFIPDGMSSFSRNSKRVFDLCVAAVSLIVFSPLFLICYLAIKLEDRGPAIYSQERIGRFGRIFKIHKFRSMRIDAEKEGPRLSSQQGHGDDRLTKVGRFLRAHHLDELPQLWNVFCGDMSFIGPRPERKYFIDQILEYDNRYTYLYQIRPGVTSYATLYNGYADTIEKMLTRLEYDLYYLQHRSWLFDIKTLWLTFYKIVTGKEF